MQPPNNWYDFLRIGENISEILRFLSHSVVKRSINKCKFIICAFDEIVICNQSQNSSFIAPDAQEEVDTWVFRHIQDMYRGGSRAAATSKIERFVIMVNGSEPLIIIIKGSILDIAVALDPPPMYRQGIWNIKLKTVDIDVVVIAIALFSRINLNKLWIEFGSGENKVFYSIH